MEKVRRKFGINRKYVSSVNGFNIRQELVIVFIKKYVSKKFQLTRAQLASAIHHTFGFKPSRQLVSRIIKQTNIVKVKVRPRMRPHSYVEPNEEIRKKFELFFLIQLLFV